MLRLHLRVAGQDFTKNLAQVRLRPFVLVHLLVWMYEQRHLPFAAAAKGQDVKRLLRQGSRFCLAIFVLGMRPGLELGLNHCSSGGWVC